MTSPISFHSFQKCIKMHFQWLDNLLFIQEFIVSRKTVFVPRLKVGIVYRFQAVSPFLDCSRPIILLLFSKHLRKLPVYNWLLLTPVANPIINIFYLIKFFVPSNLSVMSKLSENNSALFLVLFIRNETSL